jgi:hypothetical protein
LYLTGSYQAAEHHDLIHAAVHLQIFLAGCPLSWAVIGIGPIRGRPGTRQGGRGAGRASAALRHTRAGPGYYPAITVVYVTAAAMTSSPNPSPATPCKPPMWSSPWAAVMPAPATRVRATSTENWTTRQQDDRSGPPIRDNIDARVQQLLAELVPAGA